MIWPNHITIHWSERSLLEEPVPADELAEEQAHTRFEDDADARRKGE